MGQEPDSLDDERTWQQPLLGHGSSRPHDQPTARESPHEEEEVVAAPDVTDVARTSPEGEVSHVPESPSGVETSESDPNKTQPVSKDSSSEWDALPPPILDVGQVVFDKYRLLEKIGEGGMGEVWRVWHVSLETDRALKLIKPELAHNDKGWKRFQREARLMAKINHPNAVAVYDFRRTQSVGYIEMEFIRGRSLSEILKDRDNQPMPLDWTARVLEQLCAVLHEAHGHRDETTSKRTPIIHRDLKPSNLMLVERTDDAGPPRLKVLDFGIAKIIEDEGSPELTGASDLVGTPAYMSPEQIRGGFDHEDGRQKIDGRSDLYSTGVVLYHLLTGTLPFRGSKMAMLAAHLNNPPMPMKEANPKAYVPPEVERVVMQCLEKDPARRPQTARQLAEQFLQAAGLSETVSRPSSAGTTQLRRMVAVAAAVVLVAGIGLGAAMIARNGQKSSPPIDPPIPGKDSGGNGLDHTNPPPPPQRPQLWEPEGHAADDPNDIVPDHPGFPVRLRRLDRDTLLFVFEREYVYLPEGYKPESLNDTLEDEGWPRVIIRKRDGVRFIRIQGAVYQRGDPGTGPPDLDFQDKPITHHFVRVRGFYIQETEVTNAEIESYAKDHPREPDLKNWKNWYDGFQRDYPDAAKEATRYPAASVDYSAARKYALSVGGLLPTEAQWEWAAKSRTEGFRFAWGEHPTPPGERAWARLEDPSANDFSPVPSYPPGKRYSKDQTQQHVFDMVGNVRELCADPYVSYTELNLAGNSFKNPLVDQRGVVDVNAPNIKIVIRGGSFQIPEDHATAFYRWGEAPRKIPSDVGFRVVIECPAIAKK
jgi:serine/threonine protein kinase/formylglycine-generating enzyme required for sulfatase activity